MSAIISLMLPASEFLAKNTKLQSHLILLLSFLFLHNQVISQENVAYGMSQTTCSKLKTS